MWYVVHLSDHEKRPAWPGFSYWKPLRIVAFLALGVFSCAGQQSRRAIVPEITVLEVFAHRTERLVAIDGRIRNSGARSIRKLTIVFVFIAPDGQIVTKQKGALDTLEFEPGDEEGLHWQLRDHPRAVSIRIEAIDSGDRPIHVQNGGPYAIE